jgi:predicted metal-dependent hydrolase
MSRLKTTFSLVGIESALKFSSEDGFYEIALRAYYKAEARGYESDHEIQDWLDAEAKMKYERGNGK